MASADALTDDFQVAEESEISPIIEAAVPNQAQTKRKRDDKDGKKQKKRKLEAATIAQEAVSVASAPGSVQADYLKRQRERAFPKHTDLEKSEFQMSENYISDTSSIPLEERKSLAKFIEHGFPDVATNLRKQSKKKGSPRVIVVAAAALRVADLCRDVKTLAAQGEVAKLFAKHLKLAEQVQYCQKTAFSIAVAVPDRLGKLITEADALSLDSVAHLILDVSHIDQKQRSLLDHKEASQALFKHVLENSVIQEKLKAGRLKIVFF